MEIVKADRDDPDGISGLIITEADDASGIALQRLSEVFRPVFCLVVSLFLVGTFCDAEITLGQGKLLHLIKFQRVVVSRKSMVMKLHSSEMMKHCA